MAGFVADYNEPAGASGNMRLVAGVLTCGAAGAAVDVGLKYIASFSRVPKSCNTSGGVEFVKSGGTIAPQTCTAGDDLYIMAWGR